MRARGRWSILGALLGAGGLGFVLWRLDFARLGEIVARAEPGYLALVPIAIVAEQLVRAWKWRQLLYDLRPVATLRLLGAIMGGYLAGMLVPVSPLVRAWLVARLEGLAFGAVLASVAVDRLIDGVVFTVFVVAALGLAVFPDPGGGIRAGLMAAGVGSLVVFALALLLLVRFKRSAHAGSGSLTSWLDRLPAPWAGRSRTFAERFASGIIWPRAPWRRTAVVVASAAMKGIAATHLLWAGLAFGVLLEPAAYVFLIVLLGFVVIVAHFARIPAGFVLGAVFALGLFGVDEERALAMALVVYVASFATVAAVGSIALVKSGIALDELPRLDDEANGGA